ncbi:hypothetical protein SAMN05444004_1393 [Jannaschia faecimaris]|uniref:BNR repeat-like domain-containing protein n=1 Tax=Jannaschia faecimaris TaxID=1244108 RepID=A0A1H3UKU7_9RHOB|nr:sialidase family protein [Jannaschia faecimaris]SDZ62319.1 hypothetical protein SAMN05444004_1393 [Jannaschia faecimaris]
MRLALTLASISLILIAGLARAQVFTAIEMIDSPDRGLAEQPSLVALPDGRVFLSWTELSGLVEASVLTAVFDGTTWSEPVSVAQGDDLFVNFADFPSAVALRDGTIAVHWLRMLGASPYAYGVNIAMSQDGGATWGETIVPHRDDSPREHGFVSLLPDGPDGALVMWLDARSYDPAQADASDNAMQLRATTLTAEGARAEDLMLDARTCTCCQTSAAVTQDGTVLLAYRDRTLDEIRDISVVRRVDGIWSEPNSVSNDGWEIAGCPVNGPAIDAQGDFAALVWFTEADGIPAVKLAYSQDRGENFGRGHRIDLGDPSGRVDLAMLPDGTALVSWVERTDAGEALMVCRATQTGSCGTPEAVTVSGSGPSIGFPRMTPVGGDVYFAWTAPFRDASVGSGGGTFIGFARATLLP